MLPSRRAVLKGLTALLSLPMVPALAAGATGAIPFRTVRTLLLVRRRSQAEQDALLGVYDAWKTHKVITGRMASKPDLPRMGNMRSLERGTRMHQRLAQHYTRGRTAPPVHVDFDVDALELRIAAARWQHAPRPGLLLQRLDTDEWGVVTCDIREAILQSFCHDSMTMEIPSVQPDPTCVKLWHHTEEEAVRAAGGIWWPDAGRFLTPDWKFPFTAEVKPAKSWDEQESFYTWANPPGRDSSEGS